MEKNNPVVLIDQLVDFIYFRVITSKLLGFIFKGAGF